MAEKKGSNRWCFSKEKQIVDSVLWILKAFELAWFWKSEILNSFSVHTFFLPLWLPFFLVPVGRVQNQFKPFLRSWMGQCKVNLFSHILRSGSCNQFYQQCPCCTHFTACLPFVTFNPGKASMCTFPHNLPVHIHSLEIALHIH